MSHHHHYKQPSRDRPTSSLGSSSFYKGDYHSSGDHHMSPIKRRSESSIGSNKHYVVSSSTASYSADRSYEDKKYQHDHGHRSSASYHPHLSSSSHRPYDKPVGGSGHHSDHHDHHHTSRSSSSRYKPYEGGSSSSRYKGYEGGSSSSSSAFLPPYDRPIRKTVRAEFRKPYDKVSSSASSGVRRIPPPLSPPPLMKISTASSSSRYRQAPPEDHHYRSSRKVVERPLRPILRLSSSSSHEKKGKPAPERRIREPNEAIGKTSKRSVVDDETEKKIVKKKKLDTGNADETAEHKKETETNGTTVDLKIKKPEKSDHVSGTKKGKEKIETDAKFRLNPHNKPLLKLYCSYCNFRCVSFKDFSQHTRSSLHGKTMGAVVENNVKKIANLKQCIKDRQKEIDRTLDEQKTLTDTTSYCRVCEINLHTDPKEHEANETHNELKALTYRRCELCDVDFRLWKVYIFHTISLEHVKRAALKEAKEKEGMEGSYKGTNMTSEELGINLMEQRTVIFCKACVRYFPIREDGNFEESRLKHCMTLNHIKLVEDYTSRMKFIEKRNAEERARAERKKAAQEKKAKEKEKEKQKNEDKDNVEKGNTEKGNTKDNEGTSSVMEADSDVSIKTHAEVVQDEDIGTCDTSKEEDTEEGDVNNQQHKEAGKPAQVEQDQEDEEPDEDEIQLHADDDEVDAPVEDE